MPKITPSALITEIKGRWHGDQFQMWKGQIIARRASRPRQTPNLARARYKGYVSQIAGCYDGLSAQHKQSWACYSDLLPTVMSGFNAFLGRNVTLMTTQHPDLLPYHCAPAVYSSPESPAPLSAHFCVALGDYSVTWTTPADACYYVQGHYAPQSGYSNLRSPSWRHLETVAAALLSLDLDGSGFPSGTVIRFRARTLNIYGEPSPWTESVAATKS